MKLNTNAICVQLLFVCSVPAAAQYTVFSENIGNTSVGSSQLSAKTYTGYQNYNSGAVEYGADAGSTATIRDNTTSSSGYASASGGNYVYISGNNTAYFTISNINISGATNLRIAFGISKTVIADNGSNLTVQVTVGSSTVSFSPELPVGPGTGTSQWYYITSSVAVPAGSLMTINFVNNSTADNSVSYKVDDIAVLSDTPLPVTFGNIEATRTGSEVTVKWITESETNNDHFEVQASPDGTHFTTIRTVKTENGNSDLVQHYYTVIDTGEIPFLLGVPFILGFLSFGFGKRSKYRVFVILIGAVIINLLSCSKTPVPVTGSAYDALFIRIKQVDTNNDFRYSKVIRVVEN